MIGIDPMTGFFRFSYGLVELGDGIGVVPVAVGLFGLSEILLTAGQPTAPEVKAKTEETSFPRPRNGATRSGRSGEERCSASSSASFPAPLISSRRSFPYAVERRLAKHPERFGHGAIEGVAGPESANNSATSGAFVPMLALGLPSGPIPGGDDRRHDGPWNLPGPLLISQQPELSGVLSPACTSVT